MSDKPFCSWEDAVCWLRNQPDRQELVRACYYDDPLLECCRRFYESTEWVATRKLLSNCCKGTVLDIGAGRGIASYAFAKDGWRTTALEPDISDIVGSGAIRTLSEQEHLTISVVNEWGETLPFGDASFDLVYVRAVMHHSNDLKQFCSEILRVLKPGGMFLAVREHVISSHEDLQKFLELHPLHNLYGGEHAYLLKEYNDALVQARFDSIRSIKPFENPVNYSPQSKRSLCNEILKRLPIIPSFVKETLLSSEIFQNALLYVAGLFDNRPGRHYSFTCMKARP